MLGTSRTITKVLLEKQTPTLKIHMEPLFSSTAHVFVSDPHKSPLFSLEMSFGENIIKCYI